MRSLDLEDRLDAAEAIVSHRFADRKLLESALRHRSAAEHLSYSDSYERLEFLGDAVLGAIVASEVYARFPELEEGPLTELKIALVSGKMLAELSEGIGLHPLIELGEAERGTGERGIRSVLEDVYEALVGALYLDGGADLARSFVCATLGPYMTADMIARAENPKTRLQSITQSGGLGCKATPTYRLADTSGPAHSRVFCSEALVGDRVIGRGSGSSKKESEAAAAADAIARIESSGSVVGACYRKSKAEGGQGACI